MGRCRQQALTSLLTLGVYGQIQALFERAKLRAKERGSAAIGAADLHRAAMNAVDLRKLVDNVTQFDVATRAVSLDEAKEIHCMSRMAAAAQ